MRSLTVRNRIGWALCAFLTFVLCTQTPAEATSNSFEWQFKGKCCLDSSRTWTTKAKADIWITSRVQNCESTPAGVVGYTLRLMRKSGPVWKRVGKERNISCGGSVFWPKVDAGKFKFSLAIQHPARDEQTYTIKGGVFYDGSKP